MTRTESELARIQPRSYPHSREEHMMDEQRLPVSTYYADLQLEPDASPEAIEQAYQRLHHQLSSTDLSRVSDEIQFLVQERFKRIDRAYAILKNPELRAVYDAGLATATQSAPSRPREAHAVALAGGIRMTYWYSLIGLVVLVLMVTAGLLVGLRESSTVAPPSTNVMPQETSTQTPIAIQELITDPALRDSLMRQEEQIAQLRRIPADTRTVNDWVQLGNTIFDYVEVIRVSNNDAAYRVAATQWIDAAEAYAEALRLHPSDGLVRSDYALSLMRYGEMRDQPGFMQTAIVEAEQALRQDPDGLRTMLNVGLVYASARPARLDEARQLWTSVMTKDPESQLGQVAKILLQTAEP